MTDPPKGEPNPFPVLRFPVPGGGMVEVPLGSGGGGPAIRPRPGQVVGVSPTGWLIVVDLPATFTVPKGQSLPRFYIGGEVTYEYQILPNGDMIITISPKKPVKKK